MATKKPLSPMEPPDALSPGDGNDADAATPEVPVAKLKQRSPSDSKQKTTRHQRRQKGGKMRGTGRFKAKQREKRSLVEDDQRLLLEAKIWSLRVRGLTSPEIARLLDIRDDALVWQALDRWRKRLTDSIVDCAAIERYALIGAAERGMQRMFTLLDKDLTPLEAAGVVGKIRDIIDTIARMQGHNAPTEIISREVTATPEEARRLINERFAGAKAAEMRRLEGGLVIVPGGEPDSADIESDPTT